MKIVRHLALAAALGLSALNAHAASVLVVLSDADHLDLKDGKVFPTGFYLNELMQPVKRLLDAGHQVTFATPNGLAPTLDKSSDDKMYFNNDVNAWRTHRALLDKLRLTSPVSSPVISLARAAQRGYGEFDAIYIPGGHAPMQDLLTSPALGQALAAFHAAGKPTALVCHGPIALLSTLPDAPAFTRQLAETGYASAQRDWIYAGYRMTVISNAEEEIAKGLLPKGGAMKFYPQTALEQAGGKYSSNSEPFTSHIVTDRELITGQNPASATAVAQALLERLH
ncbi:type 1 glutamine amidotransferase domain-containing protein [Cronobacter turicensis]|uniref:type 1 glutamine amidotransferase domain-containing protein n=1 Tax=Cronobacter turicensis TaxID=413502 RepID=UPI0024C3655C|nr:type 1 glutamine amidotransferase domain-containing protein [Cronobacter turicensis]MDK1184232.1 type 1 glutamine amidotransferase domain-containing protein [Cronobacter turicensis]MDK1206383.1 type 1 glutamine amidotransferase domain-containing protein [Cronobacter turicensis]MDK1213576.1 type 1 glutamine amidotransferase domain-containing protein [Cronobacter turicensis]MDK1218301.1 type 1 glutamine amidotransferase domain-containing protein [Cronobacter turicensis]MDK1226918.1 type 1 glu